MGIHYEHGIRPEVYEWMLVDGPKATDVGVGANGTVWIVGNEPRPGGYGLHRWTGLRWIPQDVGAVTIEVSPKGNAWLVTDAGELLQPVDGGWRHLATPGRVVDVAVGPLPWAEDGTVWIITQTSDGQPGKVLRLVGANWVENDSSPVEVPRWFATASVNDDDEFNNDPFPGQAPRHPVSVAVMADGLPWVVDEDGWVYRKSIGTDGWIVVTPEKVAEVVISLQGNVWAVGTDERPLGHGLFRYYHGTDWHAYEGDVTHISVGPDGMPWAVDAAGRILRHHVRW